MTVWAARDIGAGEEITITCEFQSFDPLISHRKLADLHRLDRWDDIEGAARDAGESLGLQMVIRFRYSYP